MATDSAADPRILVDRPAEHVVRIRFNRPSKRNAIDQATRLALLEAVTDVLSDQSTRAVVLGGVGGVFSAGGDLPSMAGLTPDGARARMAEIHSICRLWAAAPLPIVSAMEGVAAGASVGLALLGDYVVAGPSSRVLVPFIKLGLTPDWGLMATLPRRIGLAAARRVMLAGGTFNGAEALAAGLVDELCEDDTAVMDRAIAQASTFAALPREAAARIKLRLSGGPEALEAVLAAEMEDQIACLTHPEFVEGWAAQMERRPADFLSVKAAP
ncbi:MAG: enoyl-CoA hydratase/isomerase family protein [Brevundimonas sp.]|uniref:enoyl-CoA hydratase/isomerase family protein n=1 Tax=Brevundimonas sp. TaxID=1871086 RepID=UPI00273772E4|nr:enoyl-CoA hydratase/isomerase family protein [Brevundimonas sp.]MDP3403463.1 enoyl-CoA hydratase/isomerase family protein [Brevundimonas sp.]